MSLPQSKYQPAGTPPKSGVPAGKGFFYLFLLTKAAAVAVFLGRAWQHLRWDAPYRDLLWDENWMGGIVKLLGYTDWEAYVTNPETDVAIQYLIQGIGWFYLFCALAAAFITRLGRPGRWLLRLGGVSLVILAALYTKEKFFFMGQFLEYSLQWSTPFFLAAFARQGRIYVSQVWLMKIAIALTFICHGLYAVGYYPRPELFLTMVINILGVDNDGARQFLNLAGVLDFVFGLTIFLPWRRIQLPALAYLCFWGIMTTAARVWAFVHWEYLGSGLSQWLHESVYRFPHFLLPLGLLLYLYLSSRPEELRQV